jgi:hypothetical protein
VRRGGGLDGVWRRGLDDCTVFPICASLLSQFLSQCLSLPLPVIARVAEIASLCPKAIGLFLERHVLGFPTLSTCEKMLGEDSQRSLKR